MLEIVAPGEMCRYSRKPIVVMKPTSTWQHTVHTSAHFCYKIMDCGIWDWCIVGYVQQDNFDVMTTMLNFRWWARAKLSMFIGRHFKEFSSIGNKSALFRVLTRHRTDQSYPSSLMHECITRLQLLKIVQEHLFKCDAVYKLCRSQKYALYQIW